MSASLPARPDGPRRAAGRIVMPELPARSVGEMRGARRVLLGGCAAVAAVMLGWLAAPATPAPAPAAPKLTFSFINGRAASGAPGAMFFSIFPECGCTGHTVIGQFSRRTGRLVRALGTIRTDGQIGDAATDARGGLWMTFTSGPALAAPQTDGGGPVPNTCSGALVRFDLRSGAARTVTRFPPSVLVGNAVPSPDGRRVALLEGGCSTASFDQHIVVLNRQGREQVEIGGDAAPCHWLFNVAWSPDGARLVFPYGPSNLPRNTSFVPNRTCLRPRANELAIASARRQSDAASWTVWHPERGCSYQSAAFDRTGIVASEACSHGAPAGPAYLVQLGRHGRRLARFPLRIAYEDGDVVRDPVKGHVLVSESQAGNIGVASYDWVWELNRRSLRLLGRYRTIDATVVMAQPW